MADHLGRGLRTACCANSPRFNVTEVDLHTTASPKRTQLLSTGR